MSLEGSLIRVLSAAEADPRDRSGKRSPIAREIAAIFSDSPRHDHVSRPIGIDVCISAEISRHKLPAGHMSHGACESY